MRLCYISDPNSIHTRRWVSWFSQHGHTVCVLADIRLREAWPGVEVIDLSRYFFAPIIRFPIWAAGLKLFLRRWKPDIVHAHRVNSAGWLGAMCGFHPLVVTAWGSDLNDLALQPRLAKPLASYVVRKADLFTASSQELLLQAQALGAAADRCFCVQWGVDLKSFFPGKSPELRQQLNIGDGPVILSSRTLDTIYNIDILLAAMPAVLAQFPHATLVLREHNSSPSYKEGLIKQIKDLGIESSIRWLSRLEPWEANAAAYRIADVVVSIPISDSMAVSNWEALACGAPLIAGDLPALREWIIPGENGLLVPVRNAEALGRAILQLLGDPDLQNRFRQRGLELARQNADHQTEMAKMEQLYLGLLPNRRREPTAGS